MLKIVVSLAIIFLIIPILSSANSDSLRKDSSESKKIPFLESATFSAGYEYGLIPAYSYDNYPSGGFVTEGQLALNALSLPINVGYFYSTLKNAYGLNNHIKVSLDASRLKNKLQVKRFSKKDILNKKIDSLQLIRQQNLQKMHYYKSFEKEYYTSVPKIDSPKIPSDSLPEFSLDDSINIAKPAIPNLSYAQQQDSLSKVVAMAKKYKQQAEEADDLIQKYQKEINILESLPDNQPLPAGYNPKALEYLSKIKTLEAGLCHPSFSTFLVNNIPLRGVQMELESGNSYFAFAHGKVVNNFFLTPNPIQNNLLNTQNLFNFFDFGNVKGGRKVTAVKGGVGKKDDSHLYAGLLYGLGYESYSDSLPIPSSSTKENNWVFEVDGKLHLLKNHDIQITGAHSAVQNQVPTGKQFIPPQLWDLKFRSRALLAKSTSAFPILRSRMILTCRYVDPYFKSFGVGYMRSGHVRYEIRWEQNIGKRIKASVFYRRDKDNLLGLMQYTNIIYQAGADVRWKINRSLIFRANYTPVIQDIIGPGYELSPDNKNFITLLSLTHIVNKKKMRMTNNLSVSEYNMNDTLGKLQSYKNASFNSNIEYRVFSFTNSAAWFDWGSSPVLQGQTMMFGSDIGYKFKKKAIITIGGKYSYSTTKKDEWGWRAKVAYNIRKNYALEGEIEKPVIGDFFMNYNFAEINIFPYFVAVRFIGHIGGK